MIIEEYDESLFISRFEDYKRVVTDENKNGNFSYKGLRALFNYLEEIYDEENPLKLDVISLCCDFNEYKNLNEYIKDYNTNVEEDEGEENYKNAVEEEINDKTTLIKIGDDLDEGFIIQAYYFLFLFFIFLVS